MVSPGNILFTQIQKKKPLHQTESVQLPYCQMISGEVSTQTADGESSHSDTLNPNDWIDEQSKDEDVYRVVQILKSGFRPKGGNVKRESIEVQEYLRIFKKLKVVNGILCKTAFHGGSYSYLSNRALE